MHKSNKHLWKKTHNPKERCIIDKNWEITNIQMANECIQQWLTSLIRETLFTENSI